MGWIRSLKLCFNFGGKVLFVSMINSFILNSFAILVLFTYSFITIKKVLNMNIKLINIKIFNRNIILGKFYLKDYKKSNWVEFFINKFTKIYK